MTIRNHCVRTVSTLLLLTHSLFAYAADDCKALADEQQREDCFAKQQRLPTPIIAPLSAIEVEDATPIPNSPWSRRFADTEHVQKSNFALQPYKPNYIMPFSYNNNLNREPFALLFVDDEDEAGTMDHMEAKYQISIEIEVGHYTLGDVRSRLFFAYTQTAFWQLYNSDASSPFRETNYEPEVGISYPLNFRLLGLNFRDATLSINHQSNGRSKPLSRSWNRIMGTLIFDHEQTGFALRPWVRIEERASDDDNPDITDFMGNFEFYAFRRYGEDTVGAMVRHNLDADDSHGALQIDWSRPIRDNKLKLYVQYFNGYGESLIDYNHHSNRLSVGFMFSDWL